MSRKRTVCESSSTMLIYNCLALTYNRAEQVQGEFPGMFCSECLEKIDGLIKVYDSLLQAEMRGDPGKYRRGKKGP